MRPIIRLGDKTSHGGTVVEGFAAGQCDIHGLPAAGQGHRVTCPRHTGTQHIAEGSPDYAVGGVPVALEGMATTCGATLIASQHDAGVE